MRPESHLKQIPQFLILNFKFLIGLLPSGCEKFDDPDESGETGNAQNGEKDDVRQAPNIAAAHAALQSPFGNFTSAIRTQHS